MANKRYDQFAAGTYNTAKIFLQADAISGALEKINLPTPGIYPGTGSAFTSYAKGDLIYASAINMLSKLTADADGKVLTLAAGIPSWQTPSVNVAADYTWTGLHTFHNSATPISAIAKGTIFTETLTATANSDQLYGLYVAPTFVVGTFTGVRQYSMFVANGIWINGMSSESTALRIPNTSAIRGAAASNGTIYIDSDASLNGTINLRAATLNMPSFTVPTATATFFNATGTNALFTANLSASSIGGFRVHDTVGAKSYGLEMNRVSTNGSLEITCTFGASSPTMILNQSQQVYINPAANIYPSAQLAVDSTTRGFLPPRMTTTQRNAIASPAVGLMVYDNTVNKLYVYTGAWEQITSS